MKPLSRRAFLQSSGLGLAAAYGAGRFAGAAFPASADRIRLGCIGTGRRGNELLCQALPATGEFEIVALADPFEPNAKVGQQNAHAANAGLPGGYAQGCLPANAAARLKAAYSPKIYTDYREMLDRESLDAVLIASPPHLHYGMILDCLDAGKHVFCENVIAPSIEGAREIVQRRHATGKVLQVGSQLRYDSRHLAALDIVRKGEMLGRVHHLEIRGNIDSSLRRNVPREAQPSIPNIEEHLNWRLYRQFSGGLVTEQLTRQLEVTSWLLGKLPREVSGTGGIDYWRDGRSNEDNIAVLFEYGMEPGDAGFAVRCERNSHFEVHERVPSYSVVADCRCALNNSKTTPYELVIGDEGSLTLPAVADADAVLEAEPGARVAPGLPFLRVRSSLEYSDRPLIPLRIVADARYDLPSMFLDFARCIRTGGTPRANEMVGLANVITAVSALQAIRERRVVEVPVAKMKFNFPTPDFWA